MEREQKDQHLFPMKKHWQMINVILGFWMWFWMIAKILVSLSLRLSFPWEKKVIPAFHKMVNGEARSFLLITEKGLTYRNWPWEELRCTWSDVHCIQKGRWFGAVL